MGCISRVHAVEEIDEWSVLSLEGIIKYARHQSHSHRRAMVDVVHNVFRQAVKSSVYPHCT